MLSVCIPVYNVNVGNLVKDLSDQVALLDVPVEIIVIDDRSNVDFNNANKTALANKASYIALPENVGRARIRNMFLKYAQYPYLLFLDCDSAILDKQFMTNYITEIKKGEKVICGGRVYSVTKPKREKVLHWTYGRKKESKPAAERQLKPNASFMTNNFVVERKVFEAIQLNEKIKGYGHEDTLFGYELKLKGINIKHIDNAVLHADLHTNKVFMDNAESAIRNLAEIVKTMGEDSDFTKDIALLQYYNKLKKNGLLGFVKVVFAMKRPFMRYLLCSGFASMFYLDFYKLGYYANTANK